MGRSAYVVDFAPVFFICFCTRDTGKATEKPFGNAVNRFGRGYGHNPATARSDVKAKKILYRCYVGSSDVWRRPRREWGDLAEARLFAFLRGSI
jgi:hypothetical protein